MKRIFCAENLVFTCLLRYYLCLGTYLVLQEQAGAKLSEEFSGYNYATSSDRAKFTESQRRSLDAMQSAVQRVRCKLLSISELFHEVCLPYKLWDLCLLILHVSKHSDADLIVRLWRSFIYRFVLCC